MDQLGKIFSVFGTPKSSQWPVMVCIPDYVEYQYVSSQPLRTLFPVAGDDALDLLAKMFMYDPKARISVQQALDHRYFSSIPTVTEPALLPRPPRKKESIVYKVSAFNVEGGLTILSPQRRVMPHRDVIDLNNTHEIDDHTNEIRKTGGERSGHAPMSLNFSVFGMRSLNRPTINSADRSHLKRKLDLEFLPEEEEICG